ncbi:hypothetical protein ACIA74_18045 [Streptomyces sp. NPDC051658]|uniref:hypothetical protein n=1 Tax=Streptomyces sp. NPDC051658 TaxID=3365667 RepID=UPI0037BA2C4B
MTNLSSTPSTPLARRRWPEAAEGVAAGAAPARRGRTHDVSETSAKRAWNVSAGQESSGPVGVFAWSVFACPGESAVVASPKESVINLRRTRAAVVAATAVAGIRDRYPSGSVDAPEGHRRQPDLVDVHGRSGTSEVTVEPLPHDTFSIVITGTGTDTDGQRWERLRRSCPDGAWSDRWEPCRG